MQAMHGLIFCRRDLFCNGRVLNLFACAELQARQTEEVGSRGRSLIAACPKTKEGCEALPPPSVEREREGRNENFARKLPSPSSPVKKLALSVCFISEGTMLGVVNPLHVCGESESRFWGNLGITHPTNSLFK